MTDNYLLKLQQKVLKLPFGQRIFSKLFSRQAPYFGSINPLIVLLEQNKCQVKIKKRRSLENHIGTVHVIAICNGLEMAMGAMTEASIPKHLRWLPKGMSLDYTAKAGSDIIAEACVDADDWKEGDVFVNVTARDTSNRIVVSGHIKLWVTKKPEKK